MTNPAAPPAGAPPRFRRVFLLVVPLLALVALITWALWPQSSSLSKPGVIRWGGDISGGEPYIIEGEKGEQPSGFEGDLARYLADKLGMKSEFVPAEWDSLPQLLQRGNIDLVLNGYEWSAERESQMASSIPYYAYRLELIVRKDSLIRSWADLRKPGLRVGVLKDSAADRYLQETYPELKIEATVTEGTAKALEMVQQGRYDATVQDAPVSAWYMGRRRQYPDLHVPCAPIAPVPHSYYVIFLRKSDDELRLKIDAAIRQGLEDGSLKSIYERYGLWNADQKNLLEVADHWPPAETAPQRGLGWFAGTLSLAALTTVLLACVAMPLAMLLGMTIALLRLYGPRWVAGLCVLYVEVIRGTPILLQLLVIYFFLPTIHINLPAFWAGVIGLAINYGAYEAENYRAGLLAIPGGQMEAALSLGMTRLTALRRVIVPQAARLVVPPVTNDFISLFKDTSICSVIAITELMSRYRTLMVNYQSMALEVGLMTAILYLMMSYPLSLVARRLEQQSGFRPVS
jgi:polar amino acid transport system substrate-binding protein